VISLFGPADVAALVFQEDFVGEAKAFHPLDDEDKRDKSLESEIGGYKWNSGIAIARQTM
jgi:hypothetical protein